jgi:hypothetical protein
MIKFTVALVCVFVGMDVQAAGMGDFFGRLMTHSGSQGRGITIDETLIKMSAQMNKKTPMTIDKDTRLDRVSAEPGHHFTYHYTLTAFRAKDINTADFPKLIKPQLKTRLCEATEMQNFLKNGVTVSYLYRSSDGQSIGGATFAPNECDTARTLASGQPQRQQ